jgi:hypothetical protein
VAPPPTSSRGASLADTIACRHPARGDRRAGCTHQPDHGALTSTAIRVTPELLQQLQEQPDHEPPMLSYQITTFGHAIIEALIEELDLRSPDIRDYMEALGKELGLLNQETRGHKEHRAPDAEPPSPAA